MKFSNKRGAACRRDLMDENCKLKSQMFFVRLGHVMWCGFHPCFDHGVPSIVPLIASVIYELNGSWQSGRNSP